MTIPTLVIYHGPGCADGWTAAWAVWRAVGDISTRYVPVNYGDPVPDVTGEDVAIVDFSFPRPVMEEMKAKARSVVILDHHKTAKDDLGPMIAEGAIYGVFDMNFSGARLAWNWFHDKSPIPMLVRYTEDYDLWKFKLDHSKAINAFINSYEKTFQNWDRVANEISKTPDICASIGYGILRTRDMMLSQLIETARPMAIGGYVVPVVNCPKAYSSEIGNMLCHKPHPLPIGFPPFAATYFDYPDRREFSLRSTAAQEDVEIIAKFLGGGGHRNASGFRIPLKCTGIFGVIK